MDIQNERKVAYFSMEIGLEEGVPTYSGGLGILAGDTILSGADMKVPMVAVSLLHRKGYFFQKLGPDGWQTEEPAEWMVDDFCTEMQPRVSVQIEGRKVQIRCWQYSVRGHSGYVIPVYLLDTDLDGNSPQDREWTHYLYGKDKAYRLAQEIILGIGGLRMLRALGYDQIERFHMNEGHASLLTLELLNEQMHKRGVEKGISQDDIAAVRECCVFTTHTPVAAGHDQFPMEMVKRILGEQEAFSHANIFCCDHTLNMTYLALNLSRYVNGVAKKHGEVSRHMFAQYTIDSITNGVHSRWVSQPLADLYDAYIPGWQEDNFSLRYALNIPKEQLLAARRQVKKQLIEFVNRETNVGMDIDVLTIGFARRATSYKRADLIFSDTDRLRRLAREAGPFQLVFGGKAHPNDSEGKELIKRIVAASKTLGKEIKIVYLPNYDMTLGKLLTSGVDVWLNTPQPPMEASGTSGMKAAMNGVPSLSILDGWWIEGCIENLTGWAIGVNPIAGQLLPDRAKDALSLYEKLGEVLKIYYSEQHRFYNIMRATIALNGSFFNTQRMMQQYVVKAYF